MVVQKQEERERVGRVGVEWTGSRGTRGNICARSLFFSSPSSLLPFETYHLEEEAARNAPRLERKTSLLIEDPRAMSQLVAWSDGVELHPCTLTQASEASVVRKPYADLTRSAATASMTLLRLARRPRWRGRRSAPGVELLRFCEAFGLTPPSAVVGAAGIRRRRARLLSPRSPRARSPRSSQLQVLIKGAWKTSTALLPIQTAASAFATTLLDHPLARQLNMPLHSESMGPLA